MKEEQELARQLARALDCKSIPIREASLVAKLTGALAHEEVGGLRIDNPRRLKGVVFDQATQQDVINMIVAPSRSRGQVVDRNPALRAREVLERSEEWSLGILPDRYRIALEDVATGRVGIQGIPLWRRLLNHLLRI